MSQLARLVPPVIVAIMCARLGAADHGLVYVVELLGLVVVGAWGSLTLAAIARSTLLARALARTSYDASFAGVSYRVIDAAGREAFVAGALRPVVFVGLAAVETLEDRELRAVLWHEEHHRRTLAPLQGAALGAWLRLLGRWRPIRRYLVERLALLEITADACALDRGASRSSVASALFKLDPALAGPAGTEFGGAGDQRIRALVGPQERARSRLAGPIEWAPVCFLLAMLIGCRVAGVDAPF